MNDLYLVRPEDLEPDPSTSRPLVVPPPLTGEAERCIDRGAAIDDGEGDDGDDWDSCADREDDEDEDEDHWDDELAYYENTMAYGGIRETHDSYTSSEAAWAGMLRLLISAVVEFRKDAIPRCIRGFDGRVKTVDHAYVAAHPELTEEVRARVYHSEPYTSSDARIVVDFSHLF